MTHEYKGNKAEITTRVTELSFCGPHCCEVELVSDIAHYKSGDIPFDGDEKVIAEIYRKYFNQLIDESN